MNINENRELKFKERFKKFGELECYTIYSYYDGPIIYVSENENVKFLAYWYDINEDDYTYLYIPLSEEEQIKIENKDISLSEFLKGKKAHVVEIKEIGIFDSDKEISLDTISEEQMPKKNIYLNPISI